MADVNTGCESKKRGLGNSNPYWTEELKERVEREHQERMARIVKTAKEHQERVEREHQERMARIVKTAIQNKPEPLDVWTRELQARKEIEHHERVEREHQERVARIIKTAMQTKPLPLDAWLQQKHEMGYVERELMKKDRPFHFHRHGDE